MATTGLASIRLHLQRMIGPSTAQREALRRGRDVVLTREQLSAFGHPLIPANLQDHAEWTLSGPNTLTPVIP